MQGHDRVILDPRHKTLYLGCWASLTPAALKRISDGGYGNRDRCSKNQCIGNRLRWQMTSRTAYIRL
jgi:hypothetical protein